MDMTQKKNAKEALVEKNLMHQGDRLIDCIQADAFDESLGSWKNGTLYFTDKGLVFFTEEGYGIKIFFFTIIELKKSNRGLKPSGMTVIYLNDLQKEVEQKFSIKERGVWIEYIKKQMKR